MFLTSVVMEGLETVFFHRPTGSPTFASEAKSSPFFVTFLVLEDINLITELINNRYFENFLVGRGRP